MNKILQKDGFFFEDSGRDVKVPKSAISPNGKPKSRFLKEVKIIFYSYRKKEI